MYYCEWKNNNAATTAISKYDAIRLMMVTKINETERSIYNA